MEGFIKLYRSSIDHWVFDDPELWKIWTYILLKANYAEMQTRVKQRVITLYPGQLIFGRKLWSKILKIDEYKIYRTVQLFVEAQMIELKSSNQFSIISICNWKIYQIQTEALQHAQNYIQQNAQSEILEYQPLNEIDAQQIAHQMHNDCTHKKKDKKDKNNNNINNLRRKTFAEESIPYRLSNKLKEFIINNNTNAKVPADLQAWSAEINRMIEIDKRDPLKIYEVMEFSQQDPFWQCNILSAKKLREKFDALTLKKKAKEGKHSNERNGKPSGNDQKVLDFDFSKLITVGGSDL